MSSEVPSLPEHLGLLGQDDLGPFHPIAEGAFQRLQPDDVIFTNIFEAAEKTVPVRGEADVAACPARRGLGDMADAAPQGRIVRPLQHDRRDADARDLDAAHQRALLQQRLGRRAGGGLRRERPQRVRLGRGRLGPCGCRIGRSGVQRVVEDLVVAVLDIGGVEPGHSPRSPGRGWRSAIRARSSQRRRGLSGGG